MSARNHTCIPQALKPCSINQEVLLPMLVVELTVYLEFWLDVFILMLCTALSQKCLQILGENTWFDFFKLLTGCTGALAHELVQVYPNLKVTVFDLPEVIANTSYFQPSGQHTAPVTFVSGKCSTWSFYWFLLSSSTEQALLLLFQPQIYLSTRAM